MPLKTYRYAVCGGGNLMLDMVLYIVCFHFIVQKQNVDLGIIVLSSHIASLFFVFPITLVTGFLLNNYISIVRGLWLDTVFSLLIRCNRSVIYKLFVYEILRRYSRILSNAIPCFDNWHFSCVQLSITK